jgi:hypothetical protein
MALAPGPLVGHIVVGFDSHGPSVTPDHRVLAETALSLERFGDRTAQGI